MVGMSLSVSAVAAASSAWVWIPDDAAVVETSEYTILRPPDYFDYPLAVMQFRPTGPLGEAVDRVLERSRSFGVPEVRWQARFDDPDELAGELTSRGATVLLVLDVLAGDLEGGGPVLPSPAVDVTVRWATDFETARDGSAVGITGFGGALPPDERIEENAARDAATVPAGVGGRVVAYVDGRPAGYRGGPNGFDDGRRRAAVGRGRGPVGARPGSLPGGARGAAVVRGGPRRDDSPGEGEGRHVRADPAQGRVPGLRSGTDLQRAARMTIFEDFPAHAPVLEGTRVRLEPLDKRHGADLAVAAEEDRAAYGFTKVPRGWEMPAFIGTHLQAAKHAERVPFAQVRCSDGRVIGITTFSTPRYWRGRPRELHAIEIGGTWLAASAQRAGINREAKLLLMEHAFEVLRVARLELMTDARNERSRRAIAGIGATFEGVLRNWSASYVPGEEGRLRDSAVFSVTDTEWPPVKAALRAKLSPSVGR
jgi:RimJ/RimL family protein N-acetyltransferase